MIDNTPVIAALGRRLRLGVVGGGPGSFIGVIHRAAARLDDRYQVVAAVLSSNPERSLAAAGRLGFDPARSYGSLDQMLEAEAARPDGIDVLAVMTPNDSHYAAARAALDGGLDVICDKPLTNTLDESLDLVARVRASGRVFCVTYNYTGYPMVRQARAMVAAGQLGEIRAVQVEYVQGHLAELTAAETGAASNWRMNTDKAGESLILGDIGSHAHHMACYVSGLELAQVSADVGAVVPGRKVDDYAAALLRFENDARGILWVTQAAAGAEHGLRFRLFGSKGSLEWHQEHPNQLHYAPLGRPRQVFSRAGPGLLPQAQRATRVSIGHPEGFHEAFANLYADAAEAIAARLAGRTVDPLALDFPTVEDGARGLKFIAATAESGRADGRWTDCRLSFD
jgi:predicted dehydrogenase